MDVKIYGDSLKRGKNDQDNKKFLDSDRTVYL